MRLPPSLLFGQSSSSSERLYSSRTLHDQLLTQLPQTGGAALILGLGRGQAAEAVVEVHASQSFQLWSQRAVHRGGRPLLLWTQGTQRKSGVQSKAHQLPSDSESVAAKTQKETEMDRPGVAGSCYHGRRSPSCTYTVFIYIYLFIYSFLCLACTVTAMWDHTNAADLQQRREENNKSLRKKKQKKTSPQLQSGWRKPQLMCLYCKSDRFLLPW